MKPSTLTLRVVIASLAAFLALCLATGGYEVWTLTNDVPNDTISHTVSALTVQFPWLPKAFVGFGGLFVAFWLTVILHWWGAKNFWWKPAIWVKDATADDGEESK